MVTLVGWVGMDGGLGWMVALGGWWLGWWLGMDGGFGWDNGLGGMKRTKSREAGM